jgi:hypothetical protein
MSDGAPVPVPPIYPLPWGCPMPKKRTGFSFEEHQEIGKELRDIDRKLGSLLVRVGAAYGTSSDASKAAEKSVKYVNRLRSKLDDAVCGEHPEKGDKEVIGCYYPTGERADSLERSK